MRRLLALSLGVCLALEPASLPAQAADAELSRGLQQVRDGDFENAVITLEAVVRRLSAASSAAPPAASPRSPDLVQAYVNLAVAYVALDQPEKARDRFRQALAIDRDLKLSPAEYSPKVRAVFEEARRQADQAGGGKGGSRAALITLGAVGAATAVVLATRGGTEAAAGISGARFGTPVVTCFDDSVNVPIPVQILVDAQAGDSSMTIQTAAATLIIRTSADSGEIGFASTQPTTVAPTSVGAKARATLLLTTSLICNNGPGDPGRFNEWLGRVTLTTSAGVFTAETVDLLRVNIP